jgi:hypothetical protein
MSAQARRAGRARVPRLLAAPLSRIVVVVLVALGESAIPAIATVAGGPGVARATKAVSCHAGKMLGDGEYSDGAVIWVKNMTCRQALALVKPRYDTIRTTPVSGHFRLGKFLCRVELSGPDTVKICSYRNRGFHFL